ncbi:hypothetical protein GGR51DRAFT_541144 [Nemania sp. FL0031]|nr:hypothetical protein GGR51DRAFT_541144 [Nemania sp. FL0031]
MVGIAGKSKSCNTCREKRLRCDLRRPFCRKCAKAKRQCAGYDRGDLIFVNRTPSSPSTDAPSVLSERKTQQQSKPTSADPKTEADLCRLFSALPTETCKFRQYAVDLLEATYLPKHVSAESRHGSFSWVYGLTDLTGHSKSLDTSLFAFCLSQLYVTGRADSSLYQCLDQYNVALQYLASDLDDPARRIQEETLASILVLSTCELFVCPGAKGWSTHARGISEILRLREPGMARTPAWQHLVIRMRVVCTLEALTKRQGQMILETDIWRQVVKECGLNGPLDEVYHLVADAPTTLAQAATLSSIADENVFLKESAVVAQSMLSIVNYVLEWLDGFLKRSTTPRFWPTPSAAESVADMGPSNKVFPSCFEFESLTVATPVAMCWAVTAQLYSNVIQIHDLVKKRLASHIELEALLLQADITRRDAMIPSSERVVQSIDDIRHEGCKMARYVCQSLEYFHRAEMGTFGGQSTTYPCWSARQYFRLHHGDEREWAWIQNVHNMKGAGTRWGLTMMTFPDIIEPLSVQSSPASLK